MFQTLVDTIIGFALFARLEWLVFLSKFGRKKLKENKNFILAAPFLPPFDNSGIYRPVSWLEYSKRNGWTARAVTRPFLSTPSKAGQYLLKHLPEHIPVLNTTPTSLKPAWRLFPRTNGSLLCAIGSIYGFYKTWKDNPPYAVIATGPSFDFFIIAYYLSKIFGAKLVLDYRDEWTLNPMHGKDTLHSDVYWEKRCLKNADRIIFTSQTMQETYSTTFPFLLRKQCCVLHNGWEPEDITNTIANKNDQHDKQNFVILFAGTLGVITLPNAFLQDMKKVLARYQKGNKKVQIRFIGTQDIQAQTQLDSFYYQDNLLVEGNYPKDVANRIIRDSDILLILTTKEVVNRIPLKLYEYLASEKPIIVHGTESEISNIVTQLDAGFFIAENDTDALGKALDDIASSEPSRWQNDKRQKWVEAHTRENLARDFFDILENTE